MDIWWQAKCNGSLWQLLIKKNSVVLVHKRTTLTEWLPHVGEISATFADRGCRVVSATDPHGRILGWQLLIQNLIKSAMQEHSYIMPKDLKMDQTQ
jgi:hypothetical protein